MKTIQQQMTEIVAGFEEIENAVSEFEELCKVYSAAAIVSNLLGKMQQDDAEESVELGLALDLVSELWEKREALKVSASREFGINEFCEALKESANKPEVL